MKNKYLSSLFAGLFLLSCVGSLMAQTTTFTFTGGVQTYTVPAGVSLIAVDVWGAQGGGQACYSTYQSVGGCGGRARATVSVAPGDVLRIIVGGKPRHTDSTGGPSGVGPGGYPDGGRDLNWTAPWPGAGGGGSSSIRDSTTHTEFVVAGGGGGGGGDICSGGTGDLGGKGGVYFAGTGNGNSYSCGTFRGGGGATTIAGGAAGTCVTTGLPGAFGIGGNSPTGNLGSGGGGGGWFGGGSGSEGAGGGGGSSYTNPLYASAVILDSGYNGIGCGGIVDTGNGKVVITVLCNAGTITGTLSSCSGGPTSILTNTVTGGVWSSSVTGVATISTLTASTASVTAVGPGTTTIYYAVGGCTVSAVYTVNPNPATITGTQTVCIGSATTLGETSGTTTWSSGTPTVATISATGVVTGVAAGTDVITFTLATGCYTTTTVTVNSLPVAITGPTSVCVRGTVSLTETTTGTWSTASTGVATVTASGGVVTGVSAGTANITFTSSGGCTAFYTVTVNPTPAAITVPSTVCSGTSVVATDVTAGGTWSTTSTTITVTGAGTVTGVSSGIGVITYTSAFGCDTTANITVNSSPAPITGPDSVCVRSSITILEDSTTGTWSSSAAGTASVSTTGVVTGVAGGIVTITYTMPGGCYATYSITVDALPAAIVTPSTVCGGTFVIATDATGGGTWSTTSTTITVSGAGTVTGVSTGTGIITYTTISGCDTTASITVNSTPAPITGPDSVCVRSSITLLEDSTTGTWSSSAAGTASVVSTTGVVTGVAGGIATITYTMPGGCFATYSVTADALPAAIVVPSTVCGGTYVIATDATGGGTWSTTSTTITVAGAGTVTGVSTGTGIITYTTISGCDTTIGITVNSSPDPVTGPDSVCVASTITLLEDSTTGTWSSSAAGTASVVSTTGVVTGVAGGVATITYTMPGGCYATYSVTVNALPGAIGGPTTVCTGSTVTVTDGGSGTWSSGATGIASISATGVITGIAPGSTIIYYTESTGCIATFTEIVNPQPDTIVGIDSVCVGSVVILSNDSIGGIWSVASGIATISATGTATTTVGGVTGGITTITYTMPGGCYSTQSFTVNALPAAIAGPTSVCLLSTITLTDGTGGGTWTTSNGTATIDPTSGIVTAVTVGLDTITYTLITGCLVTYTVAVDPLPTAISGPDSVCAGGGLDTLLDGTAGGTWTVSGITGTASITATTGYITGLTGGTVDVTYTIGTGCAVNYTVTVNALPAAIVVTPASGVCAGGYTIAVTDATTPGTWGETDGTGTATLTAGGILTGGNAGTVTVSYTNIFGCYVTNTVTVNPLPNAITGADTVCIGATDPLTETTGGGTWSSTTGTIATVGVGSGIVTGVAAGVDSIIFVVTATGCQAVYTVTVNPLPSAITTPPNSVCAGGYTVAITDVTAGGTWGETDGTGTATVVSTTGIVTGGAAGTVTITYQLTATGCYVTEPFTINPLPSPVVGPDTVCVGATATLTDPSPGATWSVTGTTVATIGAGSGVVSGLVAGQDTVVVILATGCFLDFPITVNPNPTAPFGNDTICVNETTILNDTTVGGTWSVAAGGIATIIPTSGIITGVIAGTTTVSYSLITGCYATMTFTVNPIPNAIGGPTSVCLGFEITATETTGGGTWSFSNGTVASVTAGGIITGLAVGTDTLYYILPTGCGIYEVITVDALPSIITGPDSVCVNSQISVLDSTGGGTWSVFNGDGTIVGAGATAVITGAIAGIDTVYYTIGSGCFVRMSFTVNPLPATIGGPTSVCVGSQITATDGSPLGTWSISPTSIATIDPITGVITGVASGTAFVTYTLPTSCYVTEAITVNPLPSSIAGIFSVCAGSTTTLFDGTPGTWSVTPPTVATIGGATGIIRGVGAGVATVTYTTGAGCYVTQTFTVDPLPGAIITPLGDTVLCTGGFVELTANTGTGYTYQWTDGGPLAGATTSSWLATTAGLYGVTVTNPFGCISSTVINVSVLPVAATITAAGATTFCGNVGVLLWADSTTTGVTYQWMHGGSGITGATNATYTATVSGTFWVTESNGAGCTAISDSIITTEIATPAGLITGGPTSFCLGQTVRLTSDSFETHYQWSLGGIPIVGATNISYVADSPGVYTVNDTGSTGCSAIGSVTVTVNPLPADSITTPGLTVFCAGGSINLFAPPGAGYTYQWYLGGLPIPGATSVSYNATNGGLYTVLVTTGFGCSAITPAGFAVTEISSLTVTPLTPTSFCWGSSAELSVSVPGVTGVTFQWYLGGTAIFGATNNTYTASTPGLYNCIVSVGAGLCSTGTNTVMLTENPLPNPIITYSLGVLYTQNYFTTYQWFEGSVMVPGATRYWLRAPSDGDYTVEVTDTNGCQSVSDVYILSVPLSVEALNSPDRNIRVYPNPTHTVVFVESDQALSAVVSSLEGKKLADIPDARQIDVSAYADGIYLLSLYNTDNTLVKVVRIVKSSN